MALALNFECSSATGCSWTQRHFGARTRSAEQHSVYIAKMDSLHFNLLHLEHVGLRLPAKDDKETKDTEQDEDEDEKVQVDHEMRRMAQQIKQAREQQRFERIDGDGDAGNDNGKFNIATQETGDGDSALTKNEQMMRHIAERVAADEAKRS